jgi:predicted lysophospholipase L1 biosynthesis ABC-type transport system permease subunit
VVGSAWFGSVQWEQAHGSGFAYVVPKTVLTLLVALLAGTPDGVGAWPLWAGLAALTASWVSFVVIQLPIRLSIRRDPDRADIERPRTDWIRVVAMAVHFALAVVLIASS